LSSTKNTSKDFLTTEDTEDTEAFVLFFSVCSVVKKSFKGANHFTIYFVLGERIDAEQADKPLIEK